MAQTRNHRLAHRLAHCVQRPHTPSRAASRTPGPLTPGPPSRCSPAHLGPQGCICRHAAGAARRPRQTRPARGGCSTRRGVARRAVVPRQTRGDRREAPRQGRGRPSAAYPRLAVFDQRLVARVFQAHLAASRLGHSDAVTPPHNHRKSLPCRQMSR